VSARPTLFGILNITEDSFSDGGRFLDPDAALAHARNLVGNGADVIDVGAASSNPRSVFVAPELEIARLAPVVEAMKSEAHTVSIDSFSSVVQHWAISQNVGYLNDIAGFADAELYPHLADSDCRLVVMHSVQGGPARERIHVPPEEILGRIMQFFEPRLSALEKAGIRRDRLIADPGMGVFLSTDPEASFAVLRGIAELKKVLGLPVLISVSRKSFLRGFLGKKPAEAGPASLAAELFAVSQGADFIRTHDPGALQDALAVTGRLELAANVS
jgi:dihydropteroate synthase type 2